MSEENNSAKDENVFIPTPMQKVPEVELSHLLREYKDNTEARNKEIETVKNQIESLTSYMGGLAAPYDAILGELYNKIQAISFERANALLAENPKASASFICASGKVTYFKGGVKRSWDLDALDAICKLDPEVKKMIWAHRKELPIEPRITIKVEI